MPIYEYRCAACGHTLEALQKLSDTLLKKCPSCKKQKLERLMSAPSFRLKGGGWYETDFKSDGEKKRNLVETADAKSKDGGDGTKSDGAPAKDGKGNDAAKDAAKENAKENAKGTAKDTGKDTAKPAAKEPKAAKKGAAKSPQSNAST